MIGASEVQVAQITEGHGQERLFCENRMAMSGEGQSIYSPDLVCCVRKLANNGE